MKGIVSPHPPIQYGTDASKSFYNDKANIPHALQASHERKRPTAFYPTQKDFPQAPNADKVKA